MNEVKVIIDGTPEPKRLYRSRTNSVVAGVCGGLGEFLGIDPALIRLLWLIAIFLGGAGVLAYIVLALVIPEESDEHSRNKQIASGWGAGWQRGINNSNVGWLLGLILIAVGGVLLLGNLNLVPDFVYRLWHVFWRVFWPAVLIALGIIVITGLGGSAWRQRHGWSTKLPLRRSRDRMVAGVCGGLAEYLGVDATLVRVLWVFGTLLSVGIIGGIAYLVLMVLMPEPDSAITRL
jgi:phage shock protein PspC (stress-responsive transcriptional regulator)